MELDLMDAFTLLLAIAALIVAVIAAVRSGKNVDEAMAERLSKMSHPDQMERLERMYERANEPVKQLVDTVAGLAKMFAPMTPFKTDDALANMMADVQVPGAPTPPAAISPQG
jgi:hypothetical protein